MACAWTDRPSKPPLCDGKWHGDVADNFSLISWPQVPGTIEFPFQLISAKYRWKPCRAADSGGTVAGVTNIEPSQIDLMPAVPDPSACSFAFKVDDIETATKLYFKRNYLFVDVGTDQPAAVYSQINNLADVSQEDKEKMKLTISDSVFTPTKNAWYYNGSSFVRNADLVNSLTGTTLFGLAQERGLALANCQNNVVPPRFENFLTQHPSLSVCSDIYYGDTNFDKVYNGTDVNCLLSRITGGIDNTSVCNVDNRLLDLYSDNGLDLNDLVRQLHIIGDPGYRFEYYYSLDWRSKRWPQTEYPFLSDADDYGTNFDACMNNVDPVTGVNVFNPAIP